MDALFNHDAWDVACLFDGAGNVLQFNTLINEDTGFSEELIEQETTNSSYQSGTTQRMMLASSEYAGLDMLTSWKQNNPPLRAAALSFQQNGRHCRWIAPTALQEMTDQPKGNRSGGDSYVRAYLQEHDAEAVRYQNLAYKVQGSEIILPLSGPVLTLSAEKGAAFTLALEAFGYGTDGTDGSSLGSSTANISAGRGSVSLVLPADTWRVEWSLDGATNAALRADGGTTYIAG